MSSDVAIRVEELSKQYRIGKRERYKALRDTLTEALAAPRRLARSVFRPTVSPDQSPSDSIWALNDVSFDVMRGEVVGIIGRNGAGKSTLLKVLSRITEPTKGSVAIRGRVASLLEVGTGFHPELSGRENVYLNGAILGMTRTEMSRKFDEIVAFAEVEKFIDTPVKHFSSGMQVRLAFAVAAHLEPEILMVDEVLAVGDAEFQKKCFAKIRSIGQGARTVLFVTHNMAAIRHICQRGIVFDRGRLTYDGEINAAVDQYLLAGNVNPPRKTVETASFIVVEVSVVSRSGPVLKTFDPVEIMVRFIPKREIQDPGVYVGILNSDGLRVAGLDFKDFFSAGPIRAGEEAALGFSIDALPLLPGDYLVEVHLKDMASHLNELVPDTFHFSVAVTPVYGGRKLDSWYGAVGLKARPLVGTREAARSPLA